MKNGLEISRTSTRLKMMVLFSYSHGFLYQIIVGYSFSRSLTTDLVMHTLEITTIPMSRKGIDFAFRPRNTI